MKLTKQNAKLELFNVNREIETKVTEHANASSRKKKTAIMDELELLWDRKDVIVRYINYHKKLENCSV
tara:strand:+ start:108 stop:311 length:204 start_codon:yes stop_codon:yes gene_type:complete